ncbi:hypothetical protein JJV70_15130 [Streptomyces sp. JJ66]|uniref:hypothetical protein n=1 Tax=Streptomyces sp. JJ66 TaxID=2803843 RepID=UPI001C5752A6|nr:hypothetical protein [Streptomyces sp. JJ66]MBW1603412.1 hypothetical protein [Streptomyces sp. JJ66]
MTPAHVLLALSFTVWVALGLAAAVTAIADPHLTSTRAERAACVAACASAALCVAAATAHALTA